MATEIQENVPGHWTRYDPSTGRTGCITIWPSGETAPENGPQCREMQEHSRMENESFGALPTSMVWTTPVKDGGAAYLIKNEGPLVLVHIPCGDCYRADPATIRDLQPQDIARYREWIREINRQTKENLRPDGPVKTNPVTIPDPQAPFLKLTTEQRPPRSLPNDPRTRPPSLRSCGGRVNAPVHTVTTGAT